MAHEPVSRRRRLERARLYLICDSRPGGRDAGELVAAALAGGVDAVQLRDKERDECTVLGAAEAVRRRCEEAGALFVVNDRPDLARAAQADGVHVGQADVGVRAARAIGGPALLVGVSTHSPAEVDAAGEAGADYIGVGPVHETPTKPGRPAVGLELVRYAAARSRCPFFAIGGIDPGNVAAILDAGARRVAVVRAIVEAEDPEAAARSLRVQVDRAAVESPVGAA